MGFGLGEDVRRFRVELSAHSGIKEFLCSFQEYILDAAWQAGIDLADSCRVESCGSCVASLAQGALDQSDQSFLVKGQLEAGYCLLCVACFESHLILKKQNVKTSFD